MRVFPFGLGEHAIGGSCGASGARRDGSCGAPAARSLRASRRPCWPQSSLMAGGEVLAASCPGARDEGKGCAVD